MNTKYDRIGIYFQKKWKTILISYLHTLLAGVCYVHYMEIEFGLKISHKLGTLKMSITRTRC